MIDCEPPTAAEVAKAVGCLKTGKAPGICGIPAELMLKSRGVHNGPVANKGFPEWLEN